MVRARETGRHNRIGAFAPQVHVEQAISMKVGEFTAGPCKTCAAEAMTAWLDAWELERLRFERLQCYELFLMK